MLWRQALTSEGCDYALILEDDVRVNRWLRRNLLAISLLQRDQWDYLSLFMPDLIASPWDRHENDRGLSLVRDSILSRPRLTPAPIRRLPLSPCWSAPVRRTR